MTAQTLYLSASTNFSAKKKIGLAKALGFSCKRIEAHGAWEDQSGEPVFTDANVEVTLGAGNSWATLSDGEGIKDLRARPIVDESGENGEIWMQFED